MKKSKEIMYQYFIAEKDGSYTKDAHIKQREVTIDFFTKYDYFLIYHPKYIYDHDDDITLNTNSWKKFKVLITKEIMKRISIIKMQKSQIYHRVK